MGNEIRGSISRTLFELNQVFDVPHTLRPTSVEVLKMGVILSEVLVVGADSLLVEPCPQVWQQEMSLGAKSG